jgi:hypothetical protein
MHGYMSKMNLVKHGLDGNVQQLFASEKYIPLVEDKNHHRRRQIA